MPPAPTAQRPGSRATRVRATAIALESDPGWSGDDRVGSADGGCVTGRPPSGVCTILGRPASTGLERTCEPAPTDLGVATVVLPGRGRTVRGHGVPAGSEMLTIHRAERAERLVDALASVVIDPLDDPFTPEVVASRPRGIERWHTQRLSTAFGTASSRHNGVWANIEFLFPGRRRRDGATTVVDPGRRYVADRAVGVAADGGRRRASRRRLDGRSRRPRRPRQRGSRRDVAAPPLRRLPPPRRPVRSRRPAGRA
jgi:hypothetical protein